MSIYQDFSSGTKKWVRGLGVALLVGLVVSSFAFAQWYLASAKKISKDISDARTLNVTGEGKIAVRPDIAVFTAGVVTESARVGDAQRANTARSNAVMEFLKSQGIDEKDIKTVGYSIYPQYQYYDVAPCYAAPCPPRRPPEIVSYQVRHTIEVKVRDLGKVDALLEGGVDKGANEVGSVSFTLENPDAAKEEARKKAIEQAEKKAKALAKDLDVRLGRIVTFSESGTEPPIIFREAAFGGDKGGFGGAGPEVAPGEQEIRSFVTITYEFR